MNAARCVSLSRLNVARRPARRSKSDTVASLAVAVVATGFARSADRPRRHSAAGRPMPGVTAANAPSR